MMSAEINKDELKKNELDEKNLEHVHGGASPSLGKVKNENDGMSSHKSGPEDHWFET